MRAAFPGLEAPVGISFIQMQDTSMRDPQRIEYILNEIREIWEQVPDWRLGQLLLNAIEPETPCPEVWFIEDTRLLRRLAHLNEQLKGRRIYDPTDPTDS